MNSNRIWIANISSGLWARESEDTKNMKYREGGGVGDPGKGKRVQIQSGLDNFYEFSG